MNFAEIDLLEQLQHFWEWVVGIQHWNTPEGWIARLIAWVIIVYFLLFLVKHILEIVAKISESWKTLGFEVKKSPEELVRLRRRQQFCKVLESDLATLAKAESWNDQFFTDLEAEVEAEGSYYASPVDRLLGRKSNGLRRVPCLIEAIQSSTEQCLLVTGAPGSGKSVALRHLANQMAEIAHKSKSPNRKIPLYLNLKELPDPPFGGPCADFIKEFVLENIRRGDADTAAYVRDNWSVNRERGYWFFLFDSFDEIPAVLHAPTGSLAIQQHAEAIRHFFEGMSACQGVLASREFKGPDTLPWKRFRILPLSPARQEELIDNSFLPPEQKAMAVQHTVASGAGFLSNPLFLTLLCRYVKEEKKPPTNDNELLLRHIYRLANREPDYLSRKYGLTPKQIIDGSVRLSVLFAEQPSLSLAPTQDQISQALSGERLPGNNLEKLLAALIDVKIGRCDVKEARAGDRRFTFAHRRYQETLFVQHLTKQPSYLQPIALLTDLRWRDYTVTLLQTSPPEIVAPLLNTASQLLNVYAANNHGIAVIPGYGFALHYYKWKDSPATGLLRLLQEGLARRLGIIPDQLRQSVKDYLAAPWSVGDSYDRLMVISLGGLLPENDLQERIVWAVRSGSALHWDAAISSSQFLTKMSEEMTRWLQIQLADRLLFARHRANVLKLEAIAARLPVNLGSDCIVIRMRLIRSFLQRFFLGVFSKINRFDNPKRLKSSSFLFSLRGVKVRAKVFTLMHLYSVVIPISFIQFAFLIRKQTKIGAGLLVVIAIWISAKIARNLWLYCFRSVGERLTRKSVMKNLSQMDVKFGQVTIIAVITIALYIGVGALLHLLAYAFGYRGTAVILYIFGPTVVFILIGFCCVINIDCERRGSIRHLRAQSRNVNGHTAIVLRASSWNEVQVWLHADFDKVIPSNADLRSFLRYIEAAAHNSLLQNGKTSLGRLESLSFVEYRSLTETLIARLLELEITDDTSAP